MQVKSIWTWWEKQLENQWMNLPRKWSPSTLGGWLSQWTLGVSQGNYYALSLAFWSFLLQSCDCPVVYLIFHEAFLPWPWGINNYQISVLRRCELRVPLVFPAARTRAKCWRVTCLLTWKKGKPQVVSLPLWDPLTLFWIWGRRMHNYISEQP